MNRDQQRFPGHRPDYRRMYRRWRTWRTTGRRARPRWWPEDETWPPMRPWPHRPGAIMWRLAAFLAIVLLIPLVACIGTLWLLGLLGEPSAQVNSAASAVLVALLVGMLLAMAIGAKRVFTPLGELIDAAGRVEAGDYSARVRARGPRELRLLGRAFNDMAQRLEITEQQRRELMAELSHELRTPVSVIQGNLEALLDGVYPADEQHLNPVLDEVHLLSRLIDDLRTLSEAETGTLALHREPTDLGVLVGEVAASYRPQAEAQGVMLELATDEDPPLLQVDPVRIREVLENLLNNALRHAADRGRITLRAASIDGYAQLTVADDGAGVAPEDLPHIFERFYKGDGSAGSGLGLTIAKDLVEAHGGTISAESQPGHGTTVRVRLPIQPE